MTAPVTTPREGEPLPRIRIFYVEDDDQLVRLVREVLPEERYEVRDARNGFEALMRIEEEMPDLVLLDLGLPEIDGYAVATRLRAIPSLARVPIIAVTAHGDRERALALGCDGFIPKPFDVDLFQGQVANYLAGHKDTGPIAREGHLATHARTLVDQLERRVQELVRANARLSELDRLRREFIQNVTHELTTPLTPAMGYVQILRDQKAGPLTPLQQKCLDATDVSLRRLKLLIDDLLDVTRLESGEFSLSLSHFHPSVVLEEALALTLAPADAKSIEIERVIGETGRIRADLAKLIQALVQLLRNAVKFTPEGGKIFVEMGQRTDGWFEFFVYDSGVGIPAEKLDRIFDPFFQVDGSMTRRFGGVGVGLTIVRRIIEAHGGRVWAESPPAKQPEGRYFRGTRICVALPAQPPTHLALAATSGAGKR